MKNILMHDRTRVAVESILQKKPHAILLVAQSGGGKGYVATNLASNLLGIELNRLSSHPYFRHIQAQNGVIAIDVVRGIQQFVLLKTTGINVVRRIIVIEDAHTMTQEAQNALLKLLEEPPRDTVFLLTAPSSKLVRQTILSRCQVLQIVRPPKQKLIAHFSLEGYSPSAVERAYAMSEGSIGLMSALLTNKEHPLIEAIDRAKELIKASVYQRLCEVDNLAKEKASLNQTVDGMQRVCNAAMLQSATKSKNNSVIQQWLRRLELLEFSQQSLIRNANPKLVLTNLFLQL